MRRLALLGVCVCACATTQSVERPELLPPLVEAPPPPPGERVAGHADALVGIASLKTVTHLPDDCTGLARYAYALEGVELMPADGTGGTNGVTAIWSAARARGALYDGMPLPGDLVFFRETYDRDRDGRLDDGLTHVGVVDAIEADGTVVFVHRSGSGVTRGRLNATRPRDRAVNDWLRTRTKTNPAALTGELFAGYARAGILLRSP